MFAGKVADTGTTYKYKMQVEGGQTDEVETKAELTGEYTGVDVSSTELPDESQCASEGAGAVEDNNEANIVPDPTSVESSPLQQQEVGAEVKEEQLQEEAAAT